MDIKNPMPTLYAPKEYWQLTADAKKLICNGCGTSGWKGRLVPSHLLWLSIKEACDIHDYMYHVGVTLDDKDEADRVFLNNMLRIVEGQSIWFLRRPRRHMAMDYYGSVRDFGGPAFWAFKNEKLKVRNGCVENSRPQEKRKMTQIFRKETGAGTYPKTFLRHSVPQSFQLDGPLALGEEILFFLVGLNGKDLSPWVNEDGDQYKFSDTMTTPIPVYSPLALHVTKPITAAPVGVKLVG